MGGQPALLWWAGARGGRGGGGVGVGGGDGGECGEYERGVSVHVGGVVMVVIVNVM